MTSDNGWAHKGDPDGVNPYAHDQHSESLTGGTGAPSAPRLDPSAGYSAPLSQAPGHPSVAGYGAPYVYPVAPFGVVPLPPLATWAQRAGGFVVDQAVPMALSIVGLIVWLPEYFTFMRELVSTAVAANGRVPILPNPFGIGYLVMMLLSLVGFGFNLWNRTFRQGRTGQSIGKQLLGLRLLNEATVAHMGAGMSFVRDVAHYVDGAAMYIGYLWPLWDPKRQTFADKICHTVVVGAENEQVPLARVVGAPADAGAAGLGVGRGAR